MTADKITPKQIKALWAKASQAHLSETVLRGWVCARTGKRSIRSLTKEEAFRLIGELLDVEVGLIDRFSADRMTAAQARWIGILRGMIGWDERRLFGLAGKMYHVKKMRNLSRGEASGLIEALKAIGKRTRKVRAA